MGAGEQVPRLHDLRATAIAWMLSAGVNVVAAARHAGHDPQVLMSIYASELDEATRHRAVEGALEGIYGSAISA